MRPTTNFVIHALAAAVLTAFAASSAAMAGPVSGEVFVKQIAFNYAN